MEIKDLFKILEKLAPGLSSADFSNSAVGKAARQISRVGVCVDPTVKNIESAAKLGIEVLISYHPWQGEAAQLIRNQGMEIWPLHATWDNTPEGVTYTLAKAIGVTDLYLTGELIIGIVDTGFRDLIERCQRSLGQNILSYSGDLKQLVIKVAIWAGPGFLPNYKKFWEVCLAEGCDTVLSSELTLSALRYSQAHQLKFVDLGHSAMAKPGMSHLVEILKEYLTAQDCSIDYFDDIYSCNFYTNCAFADQFTESEDIFFTTDL
jgi:putative NIF3 family GTP cyclohydrolase 1 type 2